MNHLTIGKNQFQKWLSSSNEEDLNDLIDHEKANLYDYAIRMTGSMNESLDGFYESRSKVFKKDPNDFSNYKVFLVTLYSEVRDNLTKHWNAKTTALENIALTKIIEDENKTLKEIEEAKQLKDLDRFISKEEGMSREIAILNGKLGFSVDEVAQILSAKVPDVVKQINNLTDSIQANLNNHNFEYTSLKKLTDHPFPEEESLHITDLQELMVGIKKKVPTSFKRIIFLVIFICLGALAYVWWMDDGKTLKEAYKYILSLKLLD